MKKRIFATVLVIAMAFSLASPAFAHRYDPSECAFCGRGKFSFSDSEHSFEENLNEDAKLCVHNHPGCRDFPYVRTLIRTYKCTYCKNPKPPVTVYEYVWVCGFDKDEYPRR